MESWITKEDQVEQSQLEIRWEFGISSPHGVCPAASQTSQNELVR